MSLLVFVNIETARTSRASFKLLTHILFQITTTYHGLRKAIANLGSFGS